MVRRWRRAGTKCSSSRFAQRYVRISLRSRACGRPKEAEWEQCSIAGHLLPRRQGSKVMAHAEQADIVGVELACEFLRDTRQVLLAFLVRVEEGVGLELGTWAITGKG